MVPDGSDKARVDAVDQRDDDRPPPAPERTATAAVAVVLWRTGPTAKSRLRFRLSASQRLSLNEAMLRDVLEAALANFDDVIIATDSASLPAAERVARTTRRGRQTVRAIAIDGSLNDVADHLQRQFDGNGDLAFLMADLPYVSADSLADLRASAHTVDVAVAASADGGTAALLLRAGHRLPTAFGPESAFRHTHRAQEHGHDVVCRRYPGLDHDLDSADDLRIVLAALSVPEELPARGSSPDDRLPGSSSMQAPPMPPAPHTAAMLRSLSVFTRGEGR